MGRPTITLACIMKNEESNIARLLDSVEGCFDHIIMTDTGSTDRSVEIAQAYGCEIRHFEWVNDFAAARNFSFKDIKTDYVMWMDLDDVLQNKEAFLRFRDDVMHLGDYWLATYHYSHKPDGTPVCSFARERVVKVSRGFEWKYFVHEGLVASERSGPISMNFIQTWSVKHMRSDEDLKKDKSRNLKLFAGREGSLDARMQYYYGKELFEAGKPFEAAIKLEKAVTNEQMELHDRIVAYQYLCYSYMQLNQFDKAIMMAQTAIQLAPHRAELYTIVADSYLKMGKLADAIPALHAAMGCEYNQAGSFASPIFYHQDSYTVYPRNQLAKIYANLGRLDLAEKFATEGLRLFNDPESKKILDEVEKMTSRIQGYKNAVPCDDIVITSPPFNAYEWDADIAKQKAMGGSETAAIEMAKNLYILSGRPVKVFNMRKEAKVCDGVEYLPNEGIHDYMAKNKPFLHIAWRHNNKVTDAPTFLWCHDLTTPGAENTQNYDRILCLTPFHKRYVMAIQGIPEEKIHVTRNGIIPGRFRNIDPSIKDPYRFVFGSSPDRGLERAMLVLDRVRETYPEITLHVHYGIEHLGKYGLGALQEKLGAMIKERPWVVYHGATQQDELMKSYAASAYCIQPSDWIETSCISAMELVLNGVFPIFRKVGGVADTLAEAEHKGMARLVDSNCIEPHEFELYAEEVKKAISEEAYKRVKMDAEPLSWENVAKEWLKELPEIAYGPTH